MKSSEPTPVPLEVLADMERAAQIALTGQHDPEFERRIHAEAEKIREEVFRAHGLLDVGVPAIRELRDGA